MGHSQSAKFVGGNRQRQAEQGCPVGFETNIHEDAVAAGGSPKSDGEVRFFGCVLVLRQYAKRRATIVKISCLLVRLQSDANMIGTTMPSNETLAIIFCTIAGILFHLSKKKFPEMSPSWVFFWPIMLPILLTACLIYIIDDFYDD